MVQPPGPRGQLGPRRLDLRAGGHLTRRATPLLALLLAAPFALASPADACADAQRHALDLWTGEVTRPVAEAFRAVLDACPAVDASPPATQAADLMLSHHAVHAAHCGFASTVEGGVASAPITAWVQAGSRTVTETDAGPATATFDPATGHTQVTATGAKWGITATNRDSGTITMHGVPIPVTKQNGVTQAAAGCGVANPDLCWASGYALARIPGLGAISAMTDYDEC